MSGSVDVIETKRRVVGGDLAERNVFYADGFEVNADYVINFHVNWLQSNENMTSAALSRVGCALRENIL